MLLMEKMGDQQLYWQRVKSVTFSGGLILVYRSSRHFTRQCTGSGKCLDLKRREKMLKKKDSRSS